MSKKPKQIRLSTYLKKWGSAELVIVYYNGGEVDIKPSEVKVDDLVALPDGDSDHPTWHEWTSSCLYKILPDL